MSMIPFDDRDGFIWHDGRLVPWRDATLHVLNHGLHYASCVFEGERVYNGKVFHMEDHNERLRNSARILGFEVPASMDDLRRATEQVVLLGNSTALERAAISAPVSSRRETGLRRMFAGRDSPITPSSV